MRYLIGLLAFALVLAIMFLTIAKVENGRLEDVNAEWERMFTDLGTATTERIEALKAELVRVIDEAAIQATKNIQFIEELQFRIEWYQKILDGTVKITIEPNEEVLN